MKRIKKSYRLFLTLIVLLSIITLTIFTSEPKSASGLLPPSIMPVVILQGSDYEMGYQYGQQAGPILVMRKEASWATALNELFSQAKAEYYEGLNYESYQSLSCNLSL